MAVGVRRKRQEAGGGLMHAGLVVAMTLRAGLQPVVGMHLRLRIVDAFDFVTAMAIRAARGVGVAKPIDLAVIGVGIGFQLFLVAGAAGVDVGDLEFVGRGV